MELLKCLRCDHEWYQRTPKVPNMCPKCKSKYWSQSEPPKPGIKKGFKYAKKDKRGGK